MKSLDLLPQNWDEEIEGDSPDMGPEEVRSANMLRALANPHRLKILKLLERTPHTVMDICERLNLRQSLASQHLARLRIDGIVNADRQGHHVVYSLQNVRVREILAVLDGARTTTRKTGARRKRVNGASSTNGRGAST
jgi:ArsR family transcriptional regulator, virulence genes transcriptional regulator